MATKVTQMSRAIGSLVALLALVFGVPVFIVAAAPSPLPSKMPVWDNIALAVEQNNIPSQVVVNAIAIVAWIIWIQLVWSLLWELAVNARNLTRCGTLRPAPFVLPGIGSLVSNLVAGALAVSVITSTTAAAATIPPPLSPITETFAAPAPVVLVIDDAATTQTSAAVQSTPPVGNVDLIDDAESVETAAATPLWQVADGDSMWSIAEDSMGEGSRVDEIINLNPQITSPRHIHTGMVLALPADATVPAANNPAANTSTAHPAGDSATTEVTVPAAEVTVTDGDHLWGISEDHIEAYDDDEVTNAEIADYLHDVVEANPDIANPNLIYPNETVVLPAAGPEPVAVDETGPESDATRRDDSSGLANVDRPDIEPSSDDAATPVQTPGASTLATPSQPEPLVVDVGDTVAVEDTDAARTDGEDTSTGSSPLPWVAGISGSVVTATGLLAALRRLQKRRAVNSALFAADIGSGGAEELVTAMVAASDVAMMRWAGQELAQMVTVLSTDSLTAGPVGYSEIVAPSATGIRKVFAPIRDPDRSWSSDRGGGS